MLPEPLVSKKLSLSYSMEFVAAFLALLAAIAVLYTFIVGRHFIIPTMILTVAILLGNLARYGYRDQRWAKHILLWFGVVLCCHAFFALFWAKAYRSFLGSSFEIVCAAIVLIMAFLVWHYARRNRLFGRFAGAG
jgi:hypothetical protein